ncbi:MAG: ATP-dependent DNA helicase RecG [Thermoleophilia bacterium]|nr:ATP-dependent DNA helicase RecG [Thermoleophilia bacterium]
MAASEPITGTQSFGGGPVPSPAELLRAPVRWPRPGRLDRPLSVLEGVGPVLEEKARAIGVETIFDLLWRVPRAYGDAPERVLLGDLEPGVSATVLVVVNSIRRIRVRRRGLSVVEAKIADSSGERKAVWFNQPWIENQVKGGAAYVMEGRLDKKGFVVSAQEPTDAGADEVPVAEGPARWQDAGATGPPGLKEGGIRGRHPGSQELRPARWRGWAWQACRLAGDLVEPLPSSILEERGLAGAVSAIREAHFPQSEESSVLAMARLAYEELFLHQAVLRRGRIAGRSGGPPAIPLEGGEATSKEWIKGLPFELTGDQRAAVSAISGELKATVPMRRLLMGEVGSGKTVVALEAMLHAAGSGAQSALMAPTEVLADQHAATVSRLLSGSGVTFALLTGSTPPEARTRLLEALAAQNLDILIGTHALLEDPVVFSRLALCVIDEEHRFGVRQRGRLDRKAPAGHGAHILHMTATPIPRTLSLTAYGDLDVTELRQLPAGRLPISTRVLNEASRAEAFEHLRGEVRGGRQAFVVCPLIEKSEALQARAAIEEAERLRETELSEFEVGLIHGQMNSQQKALAMLAFEDGRTDVLVSTTVIEVGIDVPNATVMIVEGAERFGLSQLHQLRGRVGRGRHAGACFLIAGSSGASSARRLAALAKESDGFRLAEIDLEMRGEGEITGVRQHGLPRFAVARLPRDEELLEAARSDLDRLAEDSGGLDGPELGPMLELAGRRFGPEGIRR